MDSASYQSQVLTPALGFIKGPVGGRHSGHVTFQQDGASCHTSVSTTSFLRSKGVKVLSDWPPMSPDLNLVENCWTLISGQLVGQSFADSDQLWAAVQSAWAQVPKAQVASLYGSMIRRLTAVVVAAGGNTKY